MRYFSLVLIVLLNLSCATHGDRMILQSLTEIKYLYFKPGTLDLENEEELLKVKDWIISKNRSFLIEGFYCEDDIIKNSDEAYLLEVAEKRAVVVKEKLIEKGIPFKDISTVAFGKGDEKGRCKVRILELN